MIEILKILLRNNRFPQSVIFNGENEQILLFVIKYLLCLNNEEKPCNNCISCKKIEKNVHPDFLKLEVEEKSKNIKINQIREAKNFCSMTTSGKCKIVYIKNAELMTIEAQNSLLKILEEPGQNNYFILQTKNKYKLLSTILSRCVHFNLKIENEVEYRKELDFENMKKLSFFEIYEKLSDTLNELKDINEFLKILINSNSDNVIENKKFLEVLLELEQLTKYNINKDSIIGYIVFNIKQ